MSNREQHFETVNAQFLYERDLFGEFDMSRAYATASRLRAQEFDRLVIRPLGRAIRSVTDRIRTHLDEQRTIRALSELSDHTLKDIGIHRSEITRVAIDRATRHEVEPVPARSVAASRWAAAANDDQIEPRTERLAS